MSGGRAKKIWRFCVGLWGNPEYPTRNSVLAGRYGTFRRFYRDTKRYYTRNGKS